jgi:uncharacterized membrane protein YidH (DUF202 family)
MAWLRHFGTIKDLPDVVGASGVSPRSFQIWPALIALLALISLIFVTVVACRLRTNDHISQRKHKAIGFPYLTLLAIFLLIVTMCAAPALVYAKVIGWIVIGAYLWIRCLR